MCILFFVANGNPAPGGYKLILASNRDEFYSRPALPAAPWAENPFVFGGRDMEPGREGGTWLAISGKGGVIKFGALLNITGETKKKHALGRGSLVSNYVSGYESNDEYTKNIVKSFDTEEYNGFNLVTIEIKDKKASIIHCSNTPPSIKQWSEDKPHAFGNSPPDTPLEKAMAGRDIFERMLHDQQDKELLVRNLMGMLQCRERHWPDAELKKRAPQWGEQLSSICVSMPEAGYGSRTRSVILIDWQDKLDFYEETMATSEIDGNWKKSHIFRQL